MFHLIPRDTELAQVLAPGHVFFCKKHGRQPAAEEGGLLHSYRSEWVLPLLTSGEERREDGVSESVFENSFKKLLNLLQCVRIGIFPFNDFQ